MSVESYYRDICELKAASTYEEVNRLLRDDEEIELLKIADKSTASFDGKQVLTQPMYILGWRRPKAATTEDPGVVAPHAESLTVPNIDRYEEREDFALAFALTRERRPIPPSKDFVELLKVKGKFEQGVYIYKLSNDHKSPQRLQLRSRFDNAVLL